MYIKYYINKLHQFMNLQLLLFISSAKTILKTKYQ